ncbi:hypothetical protein PybrP1_000405 [[Pythium] brassicae (nom. inval.)]|nr:hypothetical protein PybrP1_000405 [[Pythium] brassicae (nom. inval.)]
MAAVDNEPAAVARALVVAKFAAQICSACLSSFVGLHHVRAMRVATRQHRATTAATAATARSSLPSAHTNASQSQSSASELAQSRLLLQQSLGASGLRSTAAGAAASARGRGRRRARPKAAASTRILRAACFSEIAFSLTGAVVSGMSLYAPAHAKDFQLIFWAQAPHWSAQIASFLWMATLGLYIGKTTNRAAFDVAIAHAVIWLVVVFYWVLELYAVYYKKQPLLLAAKVIWKAAAIACFLLVGASWALFAHRWRRQARRKGAIVLSKLLAYTIALFVFVSPNVVVDLAQGLNDHPNDYTVGGSLLLALWPTANAAVYLTKQTCFLRFFEKRQHKHTAAGDGYSLQSRNLSTRARLGGGGCGGPGCGGPAMLMSPSSHELKGLVIGDKIGEGIAVVYSGKWRGANVAVKMKSLLIDSAEHLAEFQHACNLEIQAEAEVMKGLSHPNIVLFMEAGFYRGSICIISEYCARGSLRDVLMRSNVKHLSWPTKLRLALGICHGIQYLHNAHPPMIHRDLKSPNVLVDDSWHAKIADFGTLRFAEIVSSMQTTTGGGGSKVSEPRIEMTGLVGTTRWMAPEVMRGEKIYSSKVDIYSLALILWELIEGKLPFEATRWNHEIEDFVLQGVRPLIQDDLCPLRWKLLIVSCWQSDPAQRPTIQQVIVSLQRIAREEVWDTTAPRFTGVSSNFSSTTQSLFSQDSFVSSTVSASFMDSPPSILGSSVMRGSSIASSASFLGGASRAQQRRTQWSRLSDTLEEQQQQQHASDSDSSSLDGYSSSITIIEPISDLETGALDDDDVANIAVIESSPDGNFVVTI